MDITPLIPKNHNVINGYGVDGFKINETLYKNTIILSSQQLLEVKINTIEEIFSDNPPEIFNNAEILLIGTGANHIIIPQKIKNQIKERCPAITISEMNTGSACRTYNILMSEDRNVVAILLLPLTHD